jgi:hypothetical protein
VTFFFSGFSFYKKKALPLPRYKKDCRKMAETGEEVPPVEQVRRYYLIPTPRTVYPSHFQDPKRARAR